MDFNEVKIKKTLKELSIYLIFLITATIISFGHVSQSLFYCSDMMKHLLVDKTFRSGQDVETTFREITTVPEFWRFLEDVLLDSLHGPVDNNYFDTMEYKDPSKILEENQLLGPVRLRQLRVRNDSCEVHELFQKLFHDCYSYYSTKNEDVSNFGLKEGTAWNYHSSKELDGFFTWGQIHFYSGGGFYQDLLDNREANSQILDKLKTNNWVDRGTRVVLIEFTIYNANVNKFCNSKLIVEFTPTGSIVTSSIFRVQNLLKFVHIFDYVLFGFEVLFILQVFYYTYEEICDVITQKMSYFKYFWNWIDLSIILVKYLIYFKNEIQYDIPDLYSYINDLLWSFMTYCSSNVYIAIAFFAMGFSIFRYLYINEKLESFNENPKKFVNFDKLSFWQLQYIDFSAICVFLVWIKILKYIKFNVTMQQFSKTLSRCAGDLIGFGLMFLIVFIAYAQLGYILFGTENKDFRTFQDSIFTLMRTILGDFDYLAIESNNRTLGPIYFLTYIFFVFFVLLNMFLAIINDTYSEVKSEINKDELKIGQYLKVKFLKFFQRICACKSKKCFWSDENEKEEISLEKLSQENVETPTQTPEISEVPETLRLISEPKKCSECLKNSKAIEKLNERIFGVEVAVDHIIYKFNDFINKIQDFDNL